MLANDSDVEGQALSATSASQAAHGSVSLNSDGSFTYIPDMDYFGTDEFAYTASDGLDASQPAMVTVVVSAADDSPVANDDSYEAMENTPLVVSESGSGDVVFSTDFDAGQCRR